MKYRKTVCDNLFIINELKIDAWGFQPVDLRKKYFECIHCKKEHLTKTHVVK